MVSAKLATLADGQRQVGKFADVPSQAEAIALLNVSERTVRSARQVLNEGAPDLVSAVERGSVSGRELRIEQELRSADTKQRPAEG